MDRKLISDEFMGYTAKFNNTDERILLKIEHTTKVAALCDSIADSLEFSAREKDLAWLIGMLHDIGRFEQIRRFGTFQDVKSVDHAQFGADLLFQSGLISHFRQDLTSDELSILETAVRQHNVLHIREGLDERTQSFCNLIRDADKLDILRVNVQSTTEAIFGVTRAEMQNSGISDAVLKAFHEEHCIDKSIRNTPADLLLSHIAMAFELYYPISRKLVLQQGFLPQMLQFSFQNTETQKIFLDAGQHMLGYLRKSTVQCGSMH